MYIIAVVASSGPYDVTFFQHPMTMHLAKGKIIKVTLTLGIWRLPSDDLSTSKFCTPHALSAACVGGVSSGGVRLKFKEGCSFVRRDNRCYVLLVCGNCFVAFKI
jgi:hypothetical protein